VCIIFYNETGKTYDRETLSVAYDNNPHGVGLMWVEDGKIEVLRGLFTKKKMFEILGHFEGVPHALHFRWRTRGKIEKQLCHPFRASHKGAEKPVYMMHNGTFTDIKPPQGLSDTHVFASNMRKITDEYGTDMLFNESFLRRMEKQIMSFNKVIFLRSDGKVSIMNPSQWTAMNGIWLSNTYSLEDGYRKAKVARSLYGKWGRGKSSLQSWKGKGSSGASAKRSSVQSGRRVPVGGKDWLAKSEEWERAQRKASRNAAARREEEKRTEDESRLAERIKVAYNERALELGRSLSKREKRKIRRTVRRAWAAEKEQAQADKARYKAEREEITKRQFERLLKADFPAPAKAAPGRVLRRRRLPDGSMEEVEIMPNFLN